MQRTPELLAPLNDWKTLSPKLKVLDNADSIYFGTNFSMRARAGNFLLEELPRLSKKVHDYGDKLYICTNIVVYNDELQKLNETLEMAKRSGVDAAICYDFASMQIAKEMGLKFHISTQMNISNQFSAKYFEAMGASRINLSRELNLDQIKEIVSEVEIPVECFVHGAMCTAISGRCYLSAELMGFSQSYSANRGKCAHQCRRIYSLVGEDGELLDYEPFTGRFFSAKDLCMIEFIDLLIDSNLFAFKIEGRMRDPLYISETTQCYREAIESVKDGTYTNEKKTNWLKRLARVYNRGFHTGFYFSPPDPKDIELKVKGNASHWKHIMVGTVSEYQIENSIATIELTSGELRIGDTIIIQNDEEFYTTTKIIKLIHEGISVHNTGEASSSTHIIVLMPINEILPKNAKVFKIQKVYDPVKH
ncbi:MAG: U32 family peptidase [Candidatus Lokiarchaeota archaeon]|nr:U32 family peptidase [Candidatus Lokiarchaeota archaeon]